MTPPLSRKRVLAAILRTDFLSFTTKVFETLHPGKPPLERAWYLQAMCYAMEQSRKGIDPKLVTLLPPRHLKSTTASVAFVAWELGHNPTTKIMVASYSEDLARLHSGLTKTIMESAWYKELFPGTRIASHDNRATEFHTTKGGFRKAVSVKGTITGFGADIIIIDDCMKAEDARSAVEREKLRNWFDNTLLTRPDDKGTARILSIQQRLHEHDLPAYLIEKGYKVLCLPAIAEKEELIPTGPDQYYHRKIGGLLHPQRESQAILDQLRRDMGPRSFAAQYQQNPVAPEGNLIRIEWFGTYDERLKRHQFLKVVQSWDTGMTSAPTSDPSVCLTWGFHRDDHTWYLLDVYRRRLDFPDLKRTIIRLKKLWQADAVLIENAGSGIALASEFRTGGPFRPVMIQPILSKEDRFNGCLAEVEAGRFLLPASALWLDEFRNELRAFPDGRHDDQADAFSQFVNFQRARWKWLLTERTPDGRPINRVRLKTRPW